MIRHASRYRLLSPPILPLPVSMIEPAFFAPLMPSIGTPLLQEARLQTALGAAIAVSTITVRADEEDLVTLRPTAGSQPENSLAMNRRRHRRRGRG